MTSRLAALTIGLGVVLTTALVQSAEPDSSLKADEKTLGDARLNTDGPALLEFFRQRTLKDDDRPRVQALITKLGDDDFQVREQATTDLVTLGKRATSLLKNAVETSPDIEIVRRCQHCLEVFDKETKLGLAGAAARLLANRKPQGAVEVLLAYLPSAEDERNASELRAVLTSLAIVGGKPDPVLLTALDDKEPIRRAAAVQALVRTTKGESQQKLLKFLQDADVTVRFHTAMAFFDVNEKQSVPVLINLLTEGTLDQAYAVEDVLLSMAGDEVVASSVSKADGAVKKAQKGWQTWWAKAGEKMDLSKIDRTGGLLGLTVVVEWNQNIANGVVKEIDREGKVRWAFDNLQRPIDAVVMADNRVAVAEYTARKVTLRNFKNEEIWAKNLTTYVMGLQRVNNGNLLVICRNQVLELDRDGKEVSTYNRGASDISFAAKGRDGRLLVVTRMNQGIYVDKDGKEEKPFQIGQAGGVIGTTAYGGMDWLPNGRILLPMYQQNKVIETDDQGKILWEATVTQPNAVVKLPNGHVLATSYIGNKAVELDREGKEVWSHTGEGRYLLRVRKR
jgi:HEAT repeat protein